MRVSYEENLANYFGLQRSGDLQTEIVLSVRAKGNARPATELPPKTHEQGTTFVCRSCPDREKATPCAPLWQGAYGHGGVPEPVHAWTFQTREPGGLVGFRFQGWQLHPRTERSENASGGKSDMNANRNSDDFVVPTKWANKAGSRHRAR